MLIGRIGLFCCLFLLLAGCASSPDYPEHWAGLLETTDSCVALTGAYVNSGASGTDDKEKGRGDPELSWYFFDTAHTLGTLDRIELDFGDDRVLHARAVRDGEIVAEAEYSEEASTLDCQSDAVEVDFEHPFRRFRNPLFAGHHQESARLMKATDGALIVKRSSGRFGFGYMLLPMAYSEDTWIRFRTVKDRG